MDLTQSLALAGVLALGTTVLGGLVMLIFRAGRMLAKLDTMNDHLKTLNGSVAAVTARAHENSEDIREIKGAHRSH